jgi:hypothetical protein
LQWQARYVYQEQACDPEEKRIKQAGVILPRKGLKESRIAAACVALEWLANKDVDYPELQVLSEWKLPKVALADAAARARGALRLYWKYRGIEEIQPTYMVFTSPAEFCALATKYFRPEYLTQTTCRGFPIATIQSHSLERIVIQAHGEESRHAPRLMVNQAGGLGACAEKSCNRGQDLSLISFGREFKVRTHCLSGKRSSLVKAYSMPITCSRTMREYSLRLSFQDHRQIYAAQGQSITPVNTI